MARAKADADKQVLRVRGSAKKQIGKAKKAVADLQAEYEKSLATVRRMETENHKLFNDLEKEKREHEEVKKEREDFRNRWADLDNEMEEIRRKYEGGHDI